MDARSDRIVRIKTVLARTGLSRSTLYRKIKQGTFPKQVKISVHGAGWRESEITRWMRDLGDVDVWAVAGPKPSSIQNLLRKEQPDG